MEPRKRVTQPLPSGNSEVQQSYASSADINKIVGKHMAGPQRMQPIGDPRATRRGEFRDMPSQTYHEMLNQVTDVQYRFQSLPARLRGQFHNNPELLLRFVQDPANYDKAVKMGLIFDPDHVPKPPAPVKPPDLANASPEEITALRAALEALAPKADPEANPTYTPPKGGASA